MLQESNHYEEEEALNKYRYKLSYWLIFFLLTEIVVIFLHTRNVNSYIVYNILHILTYNDI
jgi:hypothetical protein